MAVLSAAAWRGAALWYIALRRHAVDGSRWLILKVAVHSRYRCMMSPCIWVGRRGATCLLLFVVILFKEVAEEVMILFFLSTLSFIIYFFFLFFFVFLPSFSPRTCCLLSFDIVILIIYHNISYDIILFYHDIWHNFHYFISISSIIMFFLYIFFCGYWAVAWTLPPKATPVRTFTHKKQNKTQKNRRSITAEENHPAVA